MTVYVSENRPCKFGRYREYAYLLADTDEELHTFAGLLGLGRAWFQDHKLQRHRHYDLLGRMIGQARIAGAVQTTVRDYLRAKRAEEQALHE